jgi:hypothetical protein
MIADTYFPWRKTYLAAFSDTDPAPLSLRISEAMSVLTQRQLSPLSNNEEKVMLRQAQIAMRLMLIRNEAAGNNRPLRTHCCSAIQRNPWRRTRERLYFLSMANCLRGCDLKTDATRMTIRLTEARAAINERLNNHLEITTHEHEALKAAAQKLGTLKVHHGDLIKPTTPTGYTVPS